MLASQLTLLHATIIFSHTNYKQTRLMGKAGVGAVMCDSKTKTLCERVPQRNSRLLFKGPESINVKGKAKKINVFKVYPKKNLSLVDASKMIQQKGQVRAFPFRGRQSALKRFVQEIESFQSNKHGKTLVLEGPEGVGKTRMIDEILFEITKTNEKWAVLTGDVTKKSYIQPIKSTAGECEVFQPFFAWRVIFAWLTGFSSLEVVDEDARIGSSASVSSIRLTKRGSMSRFTGANSRSKLFSTINSGFSARGKRGSFIGHQGSMPTILSPTKVAESFAEVEPMACDGS